MNSKKTPWAEHTFLILLAIVFIWPLLMVISISFSNENSIMQHGYKLIPNEWDLSGYKMIFFNPKQILDSYKITALTAFVGTFLAVFVQSLIAYPLSRESYPYRKFITFFVFFTMLFGGGLIPTYILNTQYLRLGNTPWIYILPTLVNAWQIIIMRTFFQGLPSSIVESAKIDGARETTIFFRLILPLSKPVLATMALLTLLAKWNDWFTSLIYIRDTELYTLQYLLQRILREAEFINSMAQNMPSGYAGDMTRSLPAESLRFAMVIIATGPMLMVFPFFQKYFARGLTIGAVKG